MVMLYNASSPIFLACVNHVTVLILFHVIVKYLLVTVKITKKKNESMRPLRMHFLTTLCNAIIKYFVTLGHDNFNSSVTNCCYVRSRK